MVDTCSCRRESEIIPHTHSSHSSSFSSMLLDAVYRSVDRAEGANVRASMIGKRIFQKKKVIINTDDQKVVDFQGDTWRKGAGRHNSSSSFSEYSGGGGGFFSSSSEAESFSDERRSRKQGGLLKKVYGDLKKVKQPISPGGKLAGFLNSLFTAAGNSKRHRKPSDSPAPPKTTLTSRSCLIETPSSSSARAKRSVRFSSVLDDVDDSLPRGQSKSVREENHNVDMIKTAIIKELMEHIMKKNGMANCDVFESPPSDQLRKDFEDEEDDDEFDGASCASSDLFELDILTTPNIGMERYREELPVYETTHLSSANRPIF